MVVVVRVRVVFAVALLAGGLSAGAATAADVSGWYAGIYAGGSSRNDTDVATAYVQGAFPTNSTRAQPGEIVQNAVAINEPGIYRAANTLLAAIDYVSAAVIDGEEQAGTMSFDRALTLDLAIGYALGNGGRIELRYSGTQFDASTASMRAGVSDSLYGSYLADGRTWAWIPLPFSFATTPPASGAIADVLPVDAYSMRADFLLLSGWYDVDTGTGLTPYLGGGVGIARLSATASSECAACGGPLDFGTSTKFVPAAELGAGVKVKLTDPVSLDIGYRYRMAAGAELANDYVLTSVQDPIIFSVQQSGPLSIHTLTAGITFRLN